MSLRVFRDQDGSQWRVWDVSPTLRPNVDRRGAERRLTTMGPPGGRERRAARDRRRRDPALLTPGLERGWLCFERPHEKRRLTPIPPGWQEVEETELERLLGQARGVPKRLAPE